MTKVKQDWVSKHRISSAKKQGRTDSLMLAGNEEKKRRRRRSPKYPEDSAPAMPTNAIATTHQEMKLGKKM